MAGTNELPVTPLFDGTEPSFREWRHVGGGSVHHDEEMLCLEAGDDLGLVYFAPGGFDDFRLLVQYRPEEGALAGLAFRFANPGEPIGKVEEDAERENEAYAAVETGFEVHLGSERPSVEPGTINGVLFGKGVGAQAHPQRAQVRWGEWNEFELEVRGDEYVVRLNGKETARLTNVDDVRGRGAAERRGAGFVGFLLRRGKVWIRSAELQAVEARPSAEEDAGVPRSKEGRGRRETPATEHRHH